MKIFDTKDIREIDEFTIINEPVSSIDLMERAAKGCAEWIADYLQTNTPMLIFTGPGNNGGDGWVIARLLYDKGYHNIRVYHLQFSKIISKDAAYNRQRLVEQGRVPINNIHSEDDFPVLRPSDYVIDALFGSGLSRSLEGLSCSLVKHINSAGCKVISIDIPSGLLGENNAGNPNSGIIRATHTLTFQFPKRSFFFAENEVYTGQWHIIPIGLHEDIIGSKAVNFYYSTLDAIKIRKRLKFAHKGMYGHALLIAGSYGMLGAAILASRSCLRTGTGLLTTHIPSGSYPILQTSVPEALFSIDKNEGCFAHCPSIEKYSAIGAGPGIGTSPESTEALAVLLKTAKQPLILDADALNILSSKPVMIGLIPQNTILTPHPLEFDRLAGRSPDGYQRNLSQIEFSQNHKVIVVLKGAYTSITLPDGRCYYNSTGNPGMATAGSGDVLTGMILSLLAQGYPPDEAAITGVFIHGLAGDIAAGELGQQALIASDITENIGNAFINIRNHEKAVI
jgi:NAD(P)H-hydrate epimerase